MQKHLIMALILGGLTMPVAGCTNYYRVTDPTTGKAYYTTKVDAGKGGVMKIKDEKTGSMVTLQSSQVKEISKGEYKAGMMAKAPVQPVLGQDITVSAQTFGCILDWPKVRNTRMKNSDPERLKEAMRIFRDSVPDKEYPVGTILQLVPFEAMVKHPRENFPKTNGWEFFFLDISKEGTKIKDRGESVVNLSQGITCLSCHKAAARFDFVCEKRRGCAPIPFNDQKITELQNADPRCMDLLKS
jgi:hypothetical protein